MKTLQKFADTYGFRIVPITYRFWGIKCKRKGYDLVDSQNQIHLSIEPTHYSNGDKWMGVNHAGGFSMPLYAKNMAEFIKKVRLYGFHPIEHTGYRLK